MERYKKVNRKIALLLSAGILILCAGFAVTGCGSAVLKVLDPQLGQCAVDFSLDATDTAVLTLANANFPSIAGNNLTVEAWVKPGAPTSTAAQGIFARIGSAGAILYVQGGNRNPKFALRQFTPSPPAASTSTDYTVSATTTMTQGAWYHLAGVVVNEDHGDGVGADDHGATSAIPVLCADGNGNPTGGERETPHIDIYVDGVLDNCASTWGAISHTSVVANTAHTHPVTATCTLAVMADPSHIDISVSGSYVNCSIPSAVNSLTQPTGVSDPSTFGGPKDVNVAYIGISPVSVDGSLGSQFPGAIDEVRLWTLARSNADILACANTELTSTGGGTCSVDFAKLKGYWKMNECKGSDVSDWSGGGSAGGIEINGFTPWADGWVTGAPVVLTK